jgi:hypothetical protein
VEAGFGMAYEKHFVREDLDNEGSGPFARANMDLRTTLSRVEISLGASYERTDEQAETAAKTYVPGGRKKRKIGTLSGYNAGIAWARDPFKVSYDYGVEMTRYDDLAFADGEEDSYNQDFAAGYALNDQWSIDYSLSAERSVFPNVPGGDDAWKYTEELNLTGGLDLEVWRRPRVTYSLGLEREDRQNEQGEWEQGDWEWKHTVNASDEYAFSPVLLMKYYANYTYEPTPELDDIAFTYGLSLRHELGSTAWQSLSVIREPVETFGSVTDTDSTQWNYTFNKADLFVYNLTLALSVSYAIDKPLAETTPEERVWDYSFSLVHTAEISSRLSRTLSYIFTRQDSDQEEELLDEQRITLGLRYAL